MQRFTMTAITILLLLASLPTSILAQAGPAAATDDAAAKNSYLRFDQALYRPESGECVRITVRDQDQNKNSEHSEAVEVLIASMYPENASRDREELLLQESGPDSAVFETAECLPLALGDAAEGDGTLQVHAGDLIAGLYRDGDNPQLPEGQEEIEQEIHKLFASFDVSVDVAVIAGGQPNGAFSFEIDDALIVPQSVQPLDVIAGPQGFPIIFGAGRIVFQPLDDADLASFGQQYGAQVVEQFEVPVASKDAGPNDVADLRRFAVLHLGESGIDARELPYLAELLGASGHYRFSSEAAARLFTLLIVEQLGGRLLHHDPVVWQMAVPSSEERPNPDAGPSFVDGLNENTFGAPDVRVRDAITYLDLIDRNPAHGIDMAIIDGGFARPEDYPDGDPLSGMVNPDFGLDSVSGGPNPAFQCAGGPGAGCDWHGTASLSVAAAVVDNQFGTAGVAGHGRLPDGSDGVKGLAKPVPLTAFSPFYSSVARQINRAVDEGVDLINLSAGFPCEPFIGIDFCKWETRAAAHAICTLLIIDPAWLGPIGGLLAGVIGSLGCGALHAFIGEVDFAAHDALRAAVNRAQAADIPLIAAGPEVVEFLGDDWGPFVAGDIEFLPCILDGVICVGAMDIDGGGNSAPLAIDPFGSEIDIWAPGNQLVTTPNPISSGNPGIFTGTSAAAPFISGVVAMMKAADPGISTADILAILQDTSNGFDIQPVGACEAHPVLPGTCVGYVDALAAVKRAASVDLSCFNGDGGFDDTQWAANDLGTAGIPAVGGTTTLSSGADRAIHALPDDVDFYRFRVPILPDAYVGQWVATRVSIGSPIPEFGDGLQIELFSDTDPDPAVIDLVAVEGPGTSFQAFLGNDRDHYVRVFAPDQVHERDNCYELTVEVLRPPERDRYERNEEFDEAPAVTEGWSHQHLVCPPEILRHVSDADCTDVLVDGIGAASAQELWTMTIPDLSLHSIYDRDFFHIELPDPTAHDADIVECGLTTRSDGFGGTVDITMPGALFVEAVPAGNAVSARPVGTAGEKLVAYRTTGDWLRADPSAPFRLQIDCPRTREDLREVLISFGERPSVRDAFAMGGYALRLTYLIDIQRGISPRVADMLAGREARLGGAAPCFDPGISFGPGSIPRDDFPYCPPDEEGWGHVELFRPDTSKGPNPCWNDGPCPDIFIFRVGPAFEGFAGRLRATPDLRLRLVDSDLETISEAVPTQNQPYADEHQRVWVESELKVPDLAEGLYYLILTGPAGMLEIEFPPPAMSESPQ